jgi:hypothetical protein
MTGFQPLPELTEELLTELRAVYHNANPTIGRGDAPTTHGGLRAVYAHLAELAASRLAEHERPATGRALAPLAHKPSEGPWDVIVGRKVGADRYEPVKLIIEALAAIEVAFNGADLGKVEFTDRDSGHLLVQRLPWEDTIELTEGIEIVRELDTVGYRVVVPALPPEFVPDALEAVDPPAGEAA